MDNLAQELRSRLKGEVLDDPQTLSTFSHDTSIFELKPAVVVSPLDREDLSHLITFVADHKKDHPELSLTGRSAGTDMGGGAINDSIIVDFTKHFNHIKHFENSSAVTEPGVYIVILRRKQPKKGSIYRATLPPKGLPPWVD